MRFRSLLALGIVSIGVFLFSAPQAAHAAILVLPACIEDGSCYTCDLVGLFVAISNVVLSLISGVVLFAMALGGFMWIYSAGNTEKVQKGMQIIFGAITGLIFVLCGWVMVNVALAAITGTTDFQDVKLFGTDWEKVCRNGSVPTSVTSVSTCSGITDGTPCNGGSCGTDSCSCYQEQCVNQCTYVADILASTPFTASCETESNCASVKSGTVASGEGACSANLVCCQYAR